MRYGMINPARFKQRRVVCVFVVVTFRQGGIMDKVQLYEDLGKVLYILCDYIAEESDNYLDDKKMLDVLQRAFDEIADIHESLEGDGGIYTFEPLFAAL
jgi:hypothetical protein